MTPVRPLAVMVLPLLPSVLLAWLLADPARNQPIAIRLVVGTIGLPERSQYDAFGDAVNTASRMETLTKEFKVDSILSRDTADRLRGDGVALRPLGEATVRGKANAVEVFTLS